MVLVIVVVMMIITIEPAEEAAEEAKKAHVFLLGYYRSNGIRACAESQQKTIVFRNVSAWKYGD